jgi:hypothetical protein
MDDVVGSGLYWSRCCRHSQSGAGRSSNAICRVKAAHKRFTRWAADDTRQLIPLLEQLRVARPMPTHARDGPSEGDVET